jgi:SH3-like domain-containing protein
MGGAGNMQRLVRAAATVGVALGLTGPGPAAAQTPAPTPPASQDKSAGPAVPRFASLKSDRVHLRQGPGTDHKVLWIYNRAGIPVEITKDFEGWRQVRDSEGVTGWVSQSLVSSRRTALILPWEAKAATPPQVALRSDDRESAAPVVMVEAGVIANVRTCDTRWCWVSVGDYRGYIEQKKLWGVYEGETIR